MGSDAIKILKASRVWGRTKQAHSVLAELLNFQQKILKLHAHLAYTDFSRTSTTVWSPKKSFLTHNLLNYQHTYCQWVGVIRTKSGCLFWNIESYNRRPAIKGLRTPTLTFSLSVPLLGFMGVDSDISPRQGCLFTRRLHYTDYTYLEQIDKEPPPFQSTGHGRYQRWSRWNCDFISAINYLLSNGKIYEGTCERLLKSQLGGIWQRRLIWWDI